ncbi:hypothetical protein K1X84_11140 [bacterium]|nr:hypothetical protein [bacterium]
MDQHYVNLFGLQVSDDAFFSTITAIAILVAGYAANWLYEKYVQSKRLNDVEKYYFTLIALLLPIIQRQIDELHRIVGYLVNDTDDEPKRTIINFYPLEEILKLNSEDLFKIFVNRKKSDKKTNLYAAFLRDISTANNVINSIEHVHHDLLEALNESSKKYTDAFNQIMIFHDNFLLDHKSTGTSLESDKFLLEFDRLYDKIKVNKEQIIDFQNQKSFKFNHESFILPLKKVVNDHSYDNRSRLISPFIENCLMSYYDINVRRNDFADSFKHMAKVLFDCLMSIDSTSMSTKQLENKKFFFV